MVWSGARLPSNCTLFSEVSIQYQVASGKLTIFPIICHEDGFQGIFPRPLITVRETRPALQSKQGLYSPFSPVQTRSQLFLQFSPNKVPTHPPIQSKQGPHSPSNFVQTRSILPLHFSSNKFFTPRALQSKPGPNSPLQFSPNKVHTPLAIQSKQSPKYIPPCNSVQTRSLLLSPYVPSLIHSKQDATSPFSSLPFSQYKVPRTPLPCSSVRARCLPLFHPACNYS